MKPAAEKTERLARISHQHERCRPCCHRLLRDYRSRSGLDGLLDKSMTIDTLALDGDKKAPARHDPRIVCDRMHRAIHIASLFQNLNLPTERGEQLREGDGIARH